MCMGSDVRQPAGALQTASEVYKGGLVVGYNLLLSKDLATCSKCQKYLLCVGNSPPCAKRLRTLRLKRFLKIFCA